MSSDSVLPVRLVTERVVAGYGRRGVLEDVSIEVSSGEIVAVLGHNGAGKTTLLRTIFGYVPLRGGTITFDGRAVATRADWRRFSSAMSYVPAERAVFGDLTVRENLLLGGFLVRDRDTLQRRMGAVIEIFPILEDRAAQRARTLSGGEQRMLALGIALMKAPRVMLLDEPSLGLSPAATQVLLERIVELRNRDRLAVIIVEQNVRAALRLADRAYFMRAGKIILEEPGEQALARGKWWDLF